MDKEYSFLLGVLGVTTLPFLVYSTQTVLSQSQTLEVASDDLVAPIGGALSSYAFTVPEEAVNPRLIGTYEVISGLDIDLTVLDQEGCPAPKTHLIVFLYILHPIEIAAM